MSGAPDFYVAPLVEIRYSEFPSPPNDIGHVADTRCSNRLPEISAPAGQTSNAMNMVKSWLLSLEHINEGYVSVVI
jgi:hypothetical protein